MEPVAPGMCDSTALLADAEVPLAAIVRAGPA